MLTHSTCGAEPYNQILQMGCYGGAIRMQAYYIFGAGPYKQIRMQACSTCGAGPYKQILDVGCYRFGAV